MNGDVEEQDRARHGRFAGGGGGEPEDQRPVGEAGALHLLLVGPVREGDLLAPAAARVDARQADLGERARERPREAGEAGDRGEAAKRALAPQAIDDAGGQRLKRQGAHRREAARGERRRSERRRRAAEGAPAPPEAGATTQRDEARDLGRRVEARAQDEHLLAPGPPLEPCLRPLQAAVGGGGDDEGAGHAGSRSPSRHGPQFQGTPASSR